MNETTLTYTDLNIESKNAETTSGNSSGISPKTIAALRQGSHDAYDEIFLAYYAPLKKFLAYLTRSEEDAEDLTQQVFMQLWEKRETIDPSNNLRGFLYHTAKNLTFNSFAHRKVVDKYISFSGRSFELPNTPDDIIAAKELQILIELAVSKMPPKRQEIFRLRFSEDKTNDEIAHMLGLSPETVKVHITKGKQDVQNFISSFILLILSM